MVASPFFLEYSPCTLKITNLMGINMRELIVGLDERSYPIFIGEDCFKKAGEYLKDNPIGKKYCIIADDKVADLYGTQLIEQLEKNNLQCQIITFPHGEKNKHLLTVAELASKMAQSGFDRKDAIIALGGGVTGDIAGFLASSYMRGIEFIQVPTTLLAQVDSSVGGKTGVDIPEGKNMVGAFYQPKAVFIDSAVLKTLESQEILGGLAEVIKYGVIRDLDFLKFLEKEREKILALDSDTISQVIYTCCKIKAEVVAEDEKESDVRRILNYGHTIGHAVEGASDFTIIHGLAVSIGMVAVNSIAVELGHMGKDEAEYVFKLLNQYQMPTSIPDELNRDTIKKYLLTDKKTVGGNVFFIFPKGLGNTIIQGDVPSELIESAIQ